ncbi:MAG: type VI secretion system baseplate subunit TssE [Azoarcus sp.]|jgi:type VI secretion system protein ImpF|nr:type VI secretion system baseplate subunit TssE [Azoarcus sp.]
MSRVPERTPLLPSVLDRLLDDTPLEPQRGVVLNFGLDAFKAALARDLEDLLNTRTMAFDNFANDYPLATNSVISYGLPDLSGLSLLNPEHRERLSGQLRRAITVHEPRLSQVRVELYMPSALPERQLRFRVDAVLVVHPNRPPVAFNATLQLSSNVYKVREQA